MRQSQNIPKHITISVEPADRETINRISREYDIPQRKVVSLLLEKYQNSLNQSSGKSPQEIQVLKAVEESRDQILKRMDTVLSFIREQEKVLLKPILVNDQNTYSFLKSGINEILTNLLTLINVLYER